MRFAVKTPALVLGLATSAAISSFAFSLSATAQEPAAPAAGASPPATDASAAAAPAEGGGDPVQLLEKGEGAIKAGDYAAAITAFNQAGDATLRAMQQQPPAEDLLKLQNMQIAALIGRGRAMAGMKEYEAAEKDFRSILQDQPENVPALIALGNLKLELGRADDVEDALDSFQKAVKKESTNSDALFGYGKALVLLNRVDEAISPLTRAVTIDPKNAEAFRYRGTAYSGLYKTKQAIDDLKHAIELNPEDYEAYFSLGVVHMRLEDYKPAVDQFIDAIKHYKPKPGDEDVPFYQGHLTLASAYIELGKAAKDAAAKKAAYEAANAEAQKLVSQLDTKNPAHAKVLAAALFTRGVSERMLEKIGAAVRTLTQAIELRSSQPDESTANFLNDAYFRRGICFHLIGEDKMAITDFETASHLSNDPRASLWAGFTHAKLGDYNDALKAYGDAIAASDRYTPAYYNRALTYMMTGDYKKAIVDFNDAIRLEPTNAEYYYKRGLAYQQLGDQKRAAESFAAAIEFDNKHEGAHRHMSDAQSRLGNSELAEKYRKKADELAPPKKAK
jgi:tetratricopeptide (TPR) repeat protein